MNSMNPSGALKNPEEIWRILETLNISEELKKLPNSSVHFHELHLDRIGTRLANSFFGNQGLWTWLTKCSIFTRHKTIRTGLAWVIKTYHFFRLAKRAGISFTIRELTLWTFFALTSGFIDNIIYIWTRNTFPPVRSYRKYSEFI